MTKMHNLLLAASVAATLILSACGGGDGGGGNGDDGNVPPSAGSSAASFMSFINGLNPNDETSEPLTISGSFAAPVDDVSDS